MATKKHWTEDSAKDFVFYIASDFVDTLEKQMQKMEMSKGKLARKLGVSAGRVSQILHNPGNLTLEMVVRCARAVEIKVAFLAYDDGDKENVNGPIVPEVFYECWDICGSPKDMFQIGAKRAQIVAQGLYAETTYSERTMKPVLEPIDGNYNFDISNEEIDEWQNQNKSPLTTVS